MRTSEETDTAADAGPVPAEFAPTLSHAADPFDFLARLPRPSGPSNGGADPDGDDFGRPRSSMWLGVDTPFRIGHD